MAAHGQNKQFIVDSDLSKFTFVVEHLGVATVKGSFSEIDGSVWFDALSPDSLKANIVVAVASVDTDNKLRDKELRSEDFLDADRYPTMSFLSERNGVRRSKGERLIQGRMKIYGKTRLIEVPYKVDYNPETDVLTVKTNFVVKRSDYGLSFGILMDALISEEINVAVEAIARLKQN